MRKVATAFVVALIHVAAIWALLIARSLLIPSTSKEPAPVTAWLYLPAEPAPARPPASTPRAAGNFVMTPLVDENAASGGLASLSPLPPLQPPMIALPPLAPLASRDSHVFALLGDYFACDFANYDKLDDEQRQRCALRFSHLGEIALLPPDYVDGKSTPFSLFGAQGTFAITPPLQTSFDLVDASAGCITRDHGLCGSWRPEKLGFDPSDPRRGSANAHFELAKGLSLDAGAQAWMQNYLGGGRLAVAAGIAISYRW